MHGIRDRRTRSRARALGNLGLAVCLLFGAAAASAATFVVIESREIREPREGQAQAAPERTEIWAEAERMRVDLATGRHSIVYAVERGTVQALDHERKRVLELDRSTASGAAQRLRGVESELRARTSALPPEARDAVEGLLDSAFGPEAAAPELWIRATGETGEVRGVACRTHDLWVDGERAASFCEARLEDAEIPAEAMLPLRSLAAFARDVSPLLPVDVRSAGLAALDLFDRIEGVPLRVLTFEGGKRRYEAIVSGVTQGEAPEGAFTVPADYSADIAIRVRERLGGP